MRPGDAVYEILATLEHKTPFPAGKPISVIAASSYCNFLITNGKVIGQKFWKEGLPDTVRRRDNEARRVLERAFPDRKVVMIDALALNLGGGGIHCITKQQPFLSP